MIDVAFAADEAYVPHAATMVASLLHTHDPALVRVHFLHEPSLPQTVADAFSAFVADAGSSLTLHPIDDASVADLPTRGRFSRVMWFRVFLPALLPTTAKVLYLDCDTLVVDDLSPLFALDLGGRSTGAVVNVLPADMEDRPAQLGLAAGAYFNSGVLLLDLTRWRSGSIGDEVLRVARSRGDELVLPDQDALNLVLHDDHHRLHPRWNCQNAFVYASGPLPGVDATELAEATSDPAIIHFEGPLLAKPWHYLSDHPHRAWYFEHRARTPWPDVELEGVTVLNRIVKPMPRRAQIAVLRSYLRTRAAVARRAARVRERWSSSARSPR